jgi:hypothetical protein
LSGWQVPHRKKGVKVAERTNDGVTLYQGAAAAGLDVSLLAELS